MIAILTGDIINSRKYPSSLWVEGLKTILQSLGKTPTDWEIYRGDEFQLEIKNPEDALLIALQLKAFFKAVGSDVRMSIGIGDKNYNAKKITESNGSAFIRSGDVFVNLKKQKTNLAINTGNETFDEEFNLMLRLSLSIMDNWLQPAAQFVLIALQNPSLSQEEIGVKLGINQAAVSRRQKRSQFDLIIQLENQYRKKIKTLQP